jgi:hypothetical protein
MVIADSVGYIVFNLIDRKAVVEWYLNCPHLKRSTTAISWSSLTAIFSFLNSESHQLGSKPKGWRCLPTITTTENPSAFD